MNRNGRTYQNATAVAMSAVPSFFIANDAEEGAVLSGMGVIE